MFPAEATTAETGIKVWIIPSLALHYTFVKQKWINVAERRQFGPAGTCETFGTRWFRCLIHGCRLFLQLDRGSKVTRQTKLHRGTRLSKTFCVSRSFHWHRRRWSNRCSFIWHLIKVQVSLPDLQLLSQPGGRGRRALIGWYWETWIHAVTFSFMVSQHDCQQCHLSGLMVKSSSGVWHVFLSVSVSWCVWGQIRL